jgi:hypothetical protein
MQINELNSTVRTLIQQLVDQGYKKKPICDVTLGSSFNPQFSNFLNGENLGLQPLTRLIEGLGFELHIVPIKKDNNESQVENDLQKKYDEFIQLSNQELIEYLENRPVVSRGASKNPDGGVAGALNDMVNIIVADIENNSSE